MICVEKKSVYFLVRPCLTSLGLVEIVRGHHSTKLSCQDQHFSDQPFCCVNCWFLPLIDNYMPMLQEQARTCGALEGGSP